MRKSHAARRASELSRYLGNELAVGRSITGISRKQAARLGGISHSTLGAIETGAVSPRLDTMVAACEAVGLSLSIKVYPGRSISLRDSGQLAIVEAITRRSHPTWRSATELVVDTRYGRAADLVLFGPDEILHLEIERAMADWQAQLRAARVKQSVLADRHQRPVRLVMAVEDTYRNRRMLASHLPLIRSELPGGTRDAWKAISTGMPLGQDALLWIRRPPAGRNSGSNRAG